MVHSQYDALVVVEVRRRTRFALVALEDQCKRQYAGISARTKRRTFGKLAIQRTLRSRCLVGGFERDYGDTRGAAAAVVLCEEGNNTDMSSTGLAR